MGVWLPTLSNFKFSHQFFFSIELALTLKTVIWLELKPQFFKQKPEESHSSASDLS